MNVQFFIVCLIVITSLFFGIDNLFLQEKKIAGLELKNPKKKEKLVKKAKLTGFAFLVVAVIIPVIIFI